MNLLTYSLTYFNIRKLFNIESAIYLINEIFTKTYQPIIKTQPSGKSVRLFDDARSAASSHAPKKGCGVKEVCEADLHVGVAFLLLTFLWRSKEK